jgi:putative tricarboxylic transport membrane protein
MVITAMGAFAMRGLTFDIYLMVLFGFIAVMMKEHNYPVVPVLIGVIIGPIAENSFRRSMALSGNDIGILFGSRITMILWALIVLTILWQPIKWHLKTNTDLGKRLPL